MSGVPVHFSALGTIFEIGIYRARRDEFQAAYDRDLSVHMDEYRGRFEVAGAEPPTRDMCVYTEDRFFREYGGPWHYNQVVGWLRLWAAPLRVGADVWLSTARRFARISLTRRRFHVHALTTSRA